VSGKKSQPQNPGYSDDEEIDTGGGQKKSTAREPGPGQQGQEQDPTRPRLFTVNAQGAKIIDDRGGQHQGQKTHVPTGVKEVAGYEQQNEPPPARQSPVNQQDQWQEQKILPGDEGHSVANPDWGYWLIL